MIKTLRKRVGLSLCWCVATTSIAFGYLALLEIIFIYPPQHSYNIGPPFFWILLTTAPLYSISLFLFLLVALPLFGKLAKKMPEAQRQTLSKILVTSAITTVALASILSLDFYKNLFPRHWLIFTNLLANGLVPFLFFSPLVLTWKLYQHAHKRASLKITSFTAACGIFFVIAVAVWWKLMGYWEIGKY